MGIHSPSSRNFIRLENILIIGNGGRENSLAWAIQKNELVKKVNNSEIDSTLFITLLKALTSKITVLVGYPSKKFIRFIFPFPKLIP